ncbi:LacI family DNA-binding transcriptional regulator [Lentzea flaviverrucosa]|uniref:LacI family DNA-binding transcriptional regulator n=1 Tax=Lentzea flaviverrucosa TaxID=200379 RepID=UPI001477072A|nr:LacI family DNA-binding transcriptional regulator [Lentzea flaviverrucosa]
MSIVDVARRAGVSVSTVSRSLRGETNVAAATHERVRRAVDELAYVPSPAAAGLATGRTSSIGVLASFDYRWFLTSVLEGVDSALRAAGYDLLMYNVGDAEARDHFFSSSPMRRRVDGVLAVAAVLTGEEQAVLRKLDVPVVAVNGIRTLLPRVGIDDEAGAAAAVKHLALLGHTDIAMISGNTDALVGTVTPRRAGFEAAVAALGHDTDVIVVDRWGAEGGIQGMDRLLTRSTLPSAIFTESDEMAFGALRSLRRTGVRVPEDVSLIGFDDHELAPALDLTTIAQPAREQGAVAADLLMNMIAGTADTSADIKLPTRLIVRGSTRRHLAAGDTESDEVRHGDFSEQPASSAPSATRSPPSAQSTLARSARGH